VQALKICTVAIQVRVDSISLCCTVQALKICTVAIQVRVDSISLRCSAFWSPSYLLGLLLLSLCCTDAP
jgi:hypothetical protein